MATKKNPGMLEKMKDAVAGIFTSDDKNKPSKRAVVKKAVSKTAAKKVPELAPQN